MVQLIPFPTPTIGMKYEVGILKVRAVMYGMCMVTHLARMDQSGKVANPARDQLNRENEYSPVRVRD